MSYSSRVYRQRNPQQQDPKKQKPFFSKKHDDGKIKSSRKTNVQAKLSVNEPGDSFEREADNVAGKVATGSDDRSVVQQKKISSLQRLATPAEEEKLGTNDARMKRDKDIQEKPLQRTHDKEEKKEVQKKDRPEEEKVSRKETQKEEEKIQAKQAPKEEEKLQKKDAQKEEEKIQKKEAVKEDEKLRKKDSQKEEEKVQTKKEEEESTVQAKSSHEPGSVGPGLAGRIERSAGRGEPLPPKALQEMNRRFGVDFSDVKIHNNEEGARLSEDLQAQAFTHGSDIYFNKGKFDPNSSAGKFLLAHELTHVVQQQQPRQISRKKVGSRFAHTAGAKSPFKKMTAVFDGNNFTLFGDSTQLMQTPAGSGRPYSVRKKHAAACGGSTAESYLNNPRYVGIKDEGPIPEGSFRFRASELSTFSKAEEMEILLGDKFTDPYGKEMHGGDWGAGRVELHKINVKKAKRGCGDTGSRSGFYLHGGNAPGSSGCIDIGDAGISSLLKHLDGYRGDIVVKVNYLFPPPVVDAKTRAMGRFMYPGVQNPTIADRMKAMMNDDTE